MGWFDKSKYKKKNTWNWWEHEDDNYASDLPVTEINEGYGSYNRSWGYGNSWYKPRFDMSVNLETRVRQLIKTITGRDLKLVHAHGWGADDKYFYYNASDLQDASDDEILGRILHQLARELYFDKVSVKNINATDPDYPHLLNTLEDNRADAQLQKRYAGVQYYAADLWDSRKFTDNPMNRYEPVIKTLWDVQQYLRNKHQHSFDQLKYEHDKTYKTDINRLIAAENANRARQQNSSWEFCFNINALQNGEDDFDLTFPAILEDFKKAVPYIQQYLDAPTLAEAMKVYPEIKKYYPKPNKQQHDQMDQQMAQSEGLTSEQMERWRKDAEAREAREAQAGDAGSQDAKDVYEFGLTGSLDDGEMVLEQNMAEYKRVLALRKPLIHNLHYLIRSIIKDNLIKRYARPFKRGKIDAKRIYKYLATDNLRIFKKQRVISDKKYTMTILVDQSGSMSGQNSDYAVEGTIVLAEVFEMLGLPYEIIGFDNKAYIFKKYTDGLKREYIPSLKTSMGGTDDANALQTAKERMMRFDPSNNFHKGIFVISDGEGADPRKMKDLVTEIETNYNATVFGLGIGGMPEAALKQSYNHYLHIKNIKDLPRTLVDLMKTQFKRG